MSSAPASVPLSTLRSWLATMFPGEEVPPWEVTPDTTAILTELYLANTRKEEEARLVIEAQDQATREYEGETRRLEGILSGAGVEDSLRTGPVASYIDNIAGVANTLDIDTVSGAGLEIAVTELLAREAEDVTELAKLRSENVPKMWTDRDLVTLAKLNKEIPGGSTDRFLIYRIDHI